MFEREDKRKIEQKIINFLKQSPHGATGSEIAKYLKRNRITVSKYLDVLRAEGLIDYKQIGRTKIWYLNEDIAVLELFRSRKDYLRLLYRLPDSWEITLAAGELTFLLLPSEIIPDLYLETMNYTKKYKELLEGVGSRLGRHMVHVYEMYGGVKIGELEEHNIENVVISLIHFFIRGGWGKLKDVKMNFKKKELLVQLENSVIAKALSELHDKKIEGLKNKPVCFILSGFFKGIMESIFEEFSKGFSVEETKCVFKGDEYCEFVVKPKK